ncbi:MAG: hypothetical protein CM1200mP20_08050 [Pseudomonadota bacterium]|nr:MAG: hypothetical protein CM1200mP20_08050 [Pseudomonadota bacterium]
MKLRIIFLSIVAALIAIPTASADAVKIGFVTTLTTPAGAMGRDMVEAANIALDHIGHKMGGRTSSSSLKTTASSLRSANRRPTSW